MEGAVCGDGRECDDCVDGGVCYWAVFGLGGSEVAVVSRAGRGWLGGSA